MAYRIESVQCGSVRKVNIQGRSVATAIYKTPVQGRVSVRPLGLVGDAQADLSVHGGLNKAVYAYPIEHYPMWQEARRNAGVAQIDDALPFGSMGENLSLHGLLEDAVWEGDVLRFADCALRVVQPREPCFKFNAAMGFAKAVKTMAHTGHCGFYLAVDEPGTLQAGESFVLEPGPRLHSIAELFRVKFPRAPANA